MSIKSSTNRFIKMEFNKESFAILERNYRTNLINSVTGFKSANLIGTVDGKGNKNLSIFSSVVHVGANPPLIGLVMRPVTVVRDSYDNIISTGFYTINHVSKEFYKAAHQTSARYPKGVSEFEAAGLTPWFSEILPAPYVAESPVKLGMRFVEMHEIKANNTIFIVGEIVEAFIPDELILPDGFIDLEKEGAVAISGLDSYHTTSRLSRLSYAKPGKAPEEIQ